MNWMYHVDWMDECIGCIMINWMDVSAASVRDVVELD